MSVAEIEAVQLSLDAPSGLWSDAWRRLRRNPGAIVGAFFVESLQTLTWSKLLNWHLGAMGLIIMLVIVLFPNGLRDAWRRTSFGDDLRLRSHGGAPPIS